MWKARNKEAGKTDERAKGEKNRRFGGLVQILKPTPPPSLVSII